MNCEPTLITVHRQMPFSPERVYNAWLNASIAGKWLFATPQGTMVKAETDPRVGGKFTFTELREGTEIEHSGEYLELQFPTRIVFRFGVPKYTNETQRVTVEIVPTAGGCVLTVIQECPAALPWIAKSAASGWKGLSEDLADVLASADL
jgi:uncharacterized protein YndB with AHSA1/START domain